MYAVHGAVDAPHTYLGSVYQNAAFLYSGFEIAFVVLQAFVEEYSVLKRAIFFKFTEICLKRAEAKRSSEDIDIFSEDLHHGKLYYCGSIPILLGGIQVTDWHRYFQCVY